MSDAYMSPSVLASVARRLMLATALAGLGIAQSGPSAQAGSSDGVYALGDSGSGCGGSSTCTLTSPTSVQFWGALNFTGQSGAAVLLQGTGSAMTTNVLDLSLPGVLSRTDPGSDSTTVAAISATYATLIGQAPAIDMPLDQLVSTGAGGTMAKTDILKAVSAWGTASSSLATNSPATMGTSNWIASRPISLLMSMAQPEISALTVTGDQVDAVKAQAAVAKVLFRSLSDGDLMQRDGGFIDVLTSSDPNHDGYVSFAQVQAIAFPNGPTAEQAASFARVQALLTGLSKTDETGTVVYKTMDIVRAAEADGSATDRVYLTGFDNNGQPVYSTSSTASIYNILRWYGPNDDQKFNVNATAMFKADYLGYLAGSVSASSDLQVSVAKSLMESSSLVLPTAGSVTNTKGAGIVANNTGAITLTSDVPITVSGTSIDALAAYDNGSTGDVAVTNRGRVTVSGNDVVGVKGKVSAGAGTVTVTNEGAVVLNGTVSAALRAKSVDGGAATVTNAATGTVDVSGTGSSALYASATTAGATVSNAGAISVHDGATVGIVAYTESGAFGTAANSGTISISSSVANPTKAGAIVAAGGAAAAKASNSGSVTIVGGGIPALLAVTTAANGTAEATNSGIVNVVGAGAGAIVANATGAGAATATNSGTITTAGSNSQGMIVWSAMGKASGSNAAGASIAVEGSGSWGLNVSSTTGEAVASNAGTVTVRDGFLGAVAYSDTNTSKAVNLGTISLETNGTLQTATIDGIGTTVVGALVAGTRSGQAVVENAGTITATGAATRGILAASETSDGASSVTNSGTVAAKGADVTAVSAQSAGGTVVITNSGTITAEGSGAVKGIVGGSTGGNVTVTNEGSVTASGSAAEAVTAKSTSGVVRVTNTGTLSGAVSVDAGTGSATLANSGLLDGSVSLAGASTTMTNSGRVTGTVTFGNGAGTFVLMSGGSVGKVVAGVGDTLLDVRETTGGSRTLDAATFVGFEKASLSGNADWTLTGNFSSTGFTVGGGRALLDGTLGNTSLSSGTALLGSGGVASLTAKGATVAVGDTFTTAAIGKISIGGDLTLDKASTVLVDVVKDKADLIEVKGTAHLDGALLLRGADVVGGKTITIIDANAVDQTFATTGWTEAGKWDFLKMEVVYGQTSVTVKTTDPVSTAKETLQGESKTFLNAVFGETPVLQTTQMQTAYQTIGSLISDAQGDTGKIQKTMDEVSGKATVAAANAGVVAVQAVDQAVSRASDAALGGGGGGAGGGMTMAYVEDPAEADPAQRAIGRVLYEKVPRIDSRSLIAWTTGQFGFGTSTSGASHSDFRSGGVTIGIIKRIDEAFSVGFAGGYTRSNISVENPNADLGIDSYHALLHGTWDTDTFRLNGLLGYAVQQFGGSRSVAGGSASASYGGGSVRAGLDGGYKIKWNQHEFMPFAGLDVIHGWTAGYTETGAPGGLNLTYDAATSSTVDGRIGLKWSARHKVSPGVQLEPMASVAWIHSFGDATPKVHGSMLGSSFVMTGASRNREALALAAGLTTDIGESLSIFGRYSGRLANDTTAHDFSAGLRYRW